MGYTVTPEKPGMHKQLVYQGMTITPGTYSSYLTASEDDLFGYFEITENASVLLGGTSDDRVVFQGNTVFSKTPVENRANYFASCIKLSSGTLTGSYTDFKNNRGRHGALSMEKVDVGAAKYLSLTASTFSGNEAFHGGAVTLGESGTTTSTAAFTNCLFENNKSLCDFGGGAIFLQDNVDLTLDGCTFTNNISSGEGASDDNTGNGDSEKRENGGALVLFSGSNTVNISDCSFTTEHDTIALGSTYTFNGASYVSSFDGTLNLSGNILLNAGIYKNAGTGTINAIDAVITTTATDWTNIEITTSTNSSIEYVGPTYDNVTITCDEAAQQLTLVVRDDKGDLTMNYSGADNENRKTKFCFVFDCNTVGATIMVNGIIRANSESYIENEGYTNLNEQIFGTSQRAWGYLSVEVGGNATVTQGLATLLEKPVACTGTRRIEFELNYNNAMSNWKGRAVTLGADKVVCGTDLGNDLIQGKIYADGHSLSMEGVNYQGVLYGASSNTTSGSYTSTNLSFESMSLGNGTATTRIYGGAEVSNGANVHITDGTTVTMVDVKMGEKVSVYGLGYIGVGGGTTSGTIESSGTNVINLDTVRNGTENGGDVFAGVYTAKTATGVKVTQDTVSTTIKGGYYNVVGNGSKIDDGEATIGSASLTITGGTFNGEVYGGGYAYTEDQSVIVNGNVTTTISGGTFDWYVYGGCGGQLSKYCGNTHINGNVYLNINATTSSPICFNETVFAGSKGAGKIGKEDDSDSGNVTVTFTGDASSIIWASTAGLSGGNQYTNDNYNTGIRTLQFGSSDADFDGTYSGTLRNRFDKMVITHDSDITFSKDVILDSISQWEIGADCSLTWGDGAWGRCDFAGDTITITSLNTLTSGSTTLFNDASENAELTGWDNDLTVMFGSEAATPSGEGEGAVYTGTVGSLTYTLQKEGNRITLSVANI